MSIRSVLQFRDWTKSFNGAADAEVKGEIAARMGLEISLKLEKQGVCGQ